MRDFLSDFQGVLSDYEAFLSDHERGYRVQVLNLASCQVVKNVRWSKDHVCRRAYVHSDRAEYDLAALAARFT